MRPVYRLMLLTVALGTWPVRADREVDGLRQGNSAVLRLRGEARGLVVRDRQLTEDPARVGDLLLFCRQKQVNALFVAVYELPPRRELGGERLYRWRNLIGRAHRQGITIYAMTGNEAWVYDLGRALTQIDAVAAVGAMGGPGEHFDGILFDFPLFSQLQKLFPPPERVEPPSSREDTRPDQQLVDTVTGRQGDRTPETPGERDMGTPQQEEGQPEGADLLYPTEPTYYGTESAAGTLRDREMVGQYLSCFERLKWYLDHRYKEQRLKLGITIPAWLRFPLRWRYEVKWAGDHFVDLADFVVVHNLPGQTTDIAQASDAVVRYAGRTGKTVFLRIELAYSLRPAPDLISLYNRDELFLEITLSDALMRHENTPGFGGFVLDDYQSYALMPARKGLTEPWLLPQPGPPRPLIQGGPTEEEGRWPSPGGSEPIPKTNANTAANANRPAQAQP